MKNTMNTTTVTMKDTITRKLVFTFLFLMISTMTMAGNKIVKIKTSAICDMCKNRIELVVNNLDGVKKSMLNLNDGIVRVKYNTDKLSETDIRAAIADAGYNADDMPRDEKAYNVLPACCKDGSSCDKRK